MLFVIVAIYIIVVATNRTVTTVIHGLQPLLDINTTRVTTTTALIIIRDCHDIDM
jgi:hypothetical protein